MHFSTPSSTFYRWRRCRVISDRDIGATKTLVDVGISDVLSDAYRRRTRRSFFYSRLRKIVPSSTRDGNFLKEMIPNESEALLPIRRKYRVSDALLPEIPDAEESAVEARISPTRRIMDRQRGPDFNRPRMCFISPISCFLFFFPLGILVLPRTLFYPTLFHYFSTPAAAFSYDSSLPYVSLPPLPLYPTTSFFSSSTSCRCRLDS